MQNILDSAIKKFKNSPIHQLLSENSNFIKESLNQSFTIKGIYYKRFEYFINIDFILMHNFHKNNTCICMQFLTNFNSIKTIFVNFFNQLSKNCLIFKNYSNVEILDIPSISELYINNNIYSLEFNIISYPYFFINPNISISKIIEKNGTQFNLANCNNKNLFHLTGYISFKNKIIKYKDIFYSCKSKCANRAFIICVISKIYAYYENEKVFREIEYLPETCYTCKSKLKILNQYFLYTYNYSLSYSGKIINISSNKIIIDSNQEYINKNTTILGYYFINQKGFKQIKSIHFCNNEFIKPSLSENNILSKKIEIYLSEYSKKLINLETNQSDKSLLIILNIFNLLIFKKDILQNNLKDPFSSPENSLESDCSFENDSTDIELNNKITTPLTIVIFTNDISFVKHIAINFTKAHIVYTMKSIQSNIYHKNGILCIKEISDKSEQKYKKFVDLSFIVNIDSFLEYSYKKYILLNYKQEEYNENLIKPTQELFVEFRTIFQGIIEPSRLLKSIDLLMKSLNSITQGRFSTLIIKETIRKYFKSRII